MSKTVCKEDLCCGCNACVLKCPKHCIKLTDNGRSLNAIIDTNRCINCKLCERTCQISNSNSALIKLSRPISCYEGYSKNTDINAVSSSGGFASQLSLAFTKSGGYVFGVKNDKEHLYFDCTDEPADITSFAGSKYVKVDLKDTYISIKNKLDCNERVLFFGLPCQVAGLRMFLGKEYKNLFCVDLICHGTPSYQVLVKFLQENGIKSEKGISFRNKQSMQISFNGKPLIKNGIKDNYTIGFLKGLFYTENCYHCNYSKLERVSDITIGDSWGTKRESSNGMSLILIQTKKGVELLDTISDDFFIFERDCDDAVNYNHQLSHPSIKTKKTDSFFRNYNGNTINNLVFKCYPIDVLKQKIKKIIK